MAKNIIIAVLAVLVVFLADRAALMAPPPGDNLGIVLSRCHRMLAAAVTRLVPSAQKSFDDCLPMTVVLSSCHRGRLPETGR